MNIKELNQLLERGELHQEGMFPHVEQLKTAPYVFNTHFGLDQLPTEPGIILIRGARQYGKSTWLEQQIINTVSEFGSGTAYYLNGENIADEHSLEQEVLQLVGIFRKDAKVKRIFIDEITGIPKWEMALKKLADKGNLSDVLVITTGSKTTDLRRGSEKLPGRKGKLSRSVYLFTPISYREFHRVCHQKLKSNTLFAYLLSGGSPVACSELAVNGFIPEYVIELTRDWIEGEMVRTGRQRMSLLNMMNVLFRFGMTPVGQAKLAREAALANNTVAAGYIEILNDLCCIVPAYPWDQHKKILILRKPCKYHFTNLLAAVTYHPNRMRSVDDFLALPENMQAMWYEWTVAQELLRRQAIDGKEILMPFAFWQNGQHEIDFVTSNENYFEVKRGGASALEFGWFPQQFPGKHLTVINTNKIDAKSITGVTLEAFLLEQA